MTTEILTGRDCFVAPLLAMTVLLVIANAAKQPHDAITPLTCQNYCGCPPGMFLRSIVCGLLLLGFQPALSRAEELQLPAGVVNVALPDFGDRSTPGSDYGMANVKPIEVAGDGQQAQEIRIVRPRQELRLSRRNEARFQVRLGQVEIVYFWLEAPPVHSQWRLRISVIYPDNAKETIFDSTMKGDVINYVRVPAGAVLEFDMSSIEQTFKLSKRFLLTVSPISFTMWPNFLPVPNRTFWD